jgi:hypothetical protein
MGFIFVKINKLNKSLHIAKFWSSKYHVLLNKTPDGIVKLRHWDAIITSENPFGFNLKLCPSLKLSLHDASLLATSKLVHYLIVKKHCLVKCASKLANYFNT